MRNYSIKINRSVYKIRSQPTCFGFFNCNYNASSSEATVLQPTDLPHRHRLAILTSWKRKYVFRKPRRMRRAVLIIHTREKKCDKKFGPEIWRGSWKEDNITKYMRIEFVWSRKTSDERSGVNNSLLAGKYQLKNKIRVFRDVITCQLANVYWHFDGYQTECVQTFRMISVSITVDRHKHPRRQQYCWDTLKPCNKMLLSIPARNRRSCVNKLTGIRHSNHLSLTNTRV